MASSKSSHAFSELLLTCNPYSDINIQSLHNYSFSSFFIVSNDITASRYYRYFHEYLTVTYFPSYKFQIFAASFNRRCLQILTPLLLNENQISCFNSRMQLNKNMYGRRQLYKIRLALTTPDLQPIIRFVFLQHESSPDSLF